MTFRSIALALRPFISDTYNLLDATDAVLDLIPAERVPVTSSYPQTNIPHQYLVQIVLGNPTILGFLVDKQKISAIKELRRITGSGLKQTKEAVEDNLVSSEVALVALRQKLQG